MLQLADALSQFTTAVEKHECEPVEMFTKYFWLLLDEEAENFPTTDS